MRDALDDDYQGHDTLTTIWHGLQALCVCVVGVFALMAISLWTLVAGTCFWAWHRLRGKPLPTPNYDFDDVA